jgi:hypothetical protein
MKAMTVAPHTNLEIQSRQARLQSQIKGLDIWAGKIAISNKGAGPSH